MGIGGKVEAATLLLTCIPPRHVHILALHPGTRKGAGDVSEDGESKRERGK